MIKMKSPAPNRKGVYEIHDVVSRRVNALKAQGWTEVKPEKKAAAKAEVDSTPEKKPAKSSKKKAAAKAEE